MKIAIIDDSKTFVSFLKKQLKNIDYHNITVFTDPDEYIKWIKQNPDTDMVFIDYHLKNTDGFEILKQTQELLPYAYKVMITSDENPDLKQKALNEGFDSFVNKNINSVDLLALLNTVKVLRKYIKKEIAKKEQFKKILQYKESQEKFIHQKQNKIMKNELEMFFDNNYLFETFFQPKDLLTGDTIYSKKIGKNEYFFSVIDAMGKGLGASLTSFNSLSFLKHAIKKAIDYNDFNFEKLVKDFVDYIKSILLENEILCVTLVYINNEKLIFANFGNPPIFASKPIPANNYPIRVATDKNSININSTDMEDKILITSDGLIEAPYQNTIYYKRVKEIFPKICFLKDLIKDFEKNSSQSDDISLVYIKKENATYKTVYEKEFIINKKNIDTVLLEIINSNIKQKEKINLILHEILTNTLEHSILKIKNKEKLKKEKKILTINDTNEKFLAKINISKNDNMIKIEYSDNTKGFDIQTIKDAYYNNYHGRGVKIIKHLADGLFFNENGTAIKIYLKVQP